MTDLLLDSDVLIDHLRKYPPAKSYFQEKFSQARELSVSVITEAEILAGKKLEDADCRLLVGHFLSHFSKIPVSSEIACLAGEFKRKYNIRLMDALIGATAVINDLMLITRNIKHYRNISELQVEKPYE